MQNMIQKHDTYYSQSNKFIKLFAGNSVPSFKLHLDIYFFLFYLFGVSFSFVGFFVIVIFLRIVVVG